MWRDLRAANKRDAGKGGIPPMLHTAHGWPALPDHGRWAGNMRLFGTTILLAFGLLTSTGCMSSRNAREHNYVILHEVGRGYSELIFSRREWGGFWGPEGYIGFRDVGYSAILSGAGPLYTNPFFNDNPPGRCIGTITMNREQSRVTLSMSRVVSKPGAPERTHAHPANGTYPIKSVIIFTPRQQEAWLKDWTGSRK